MIEIYSLEERGRFLRLFHHGWLQVESPILGIQLTPYSARDLAAVLVEWADEEERLFDE